MTLYRKKLKIVVLEPENYHTLLNVKISGIDARAVLDTGASHSCIDKAFVNQYFPEMNMDEKEGLNAGIGGTGFEVHTTDLRDFRLGHFRQDIMKEIAVIDFQHINAAYIYLKMKPVQMILGNDFLIRHKAVIDYSCNTLFFRK